MIFGAPLGVGGLGTHALQVLSAFASTATDVHALGRASSAHTLPSSNLTLETEIPDLSDWQRRYTTLRWRHGELQLRRDQALGEWARERCQSLRPNVCYAFTQVALETLRWARDQGIPTILDNPNGHIRHQHDVCLREADRHCRVSYLGHPSMRMVERVESEYQLADQIRVSSQWAKDSMVARDVPAAKIIVTTLAVDTVMFHPKHSSLGERGPLRILYVGSLSLGKGFVYLLRAVRSLGSLVQLEIVGSTGDRCARILFERESLKLDVRQLASHPLEAYQRAELFVSPTLHDGFGYVVAEAMACGLPVVVTDQAGAAELVVENENGWTCRAGNEESIREAIEKALHRRSELRGMGKLGRDVALGISQSGELGRFIASLV